MNNALCERIVILSRYLIKEIFGSLLAVTFVLLLIFLSNQLVRYLTYAASGKIAANILLQLLGFEVPFLLALFLPLGLYLGIILAYGRLYADNELSVMQACGLSQKKLFEITGFYSVGIALLTLLLTFWINPWIAAQKQRVLAEGMSLENVLSTLTPGRFQVSSDGQKVIYIERVSRNRKIAENLFFADQDHPGVNNLPSSWSVISAARGYLVADKRDKTNKQHLLVAEEGYRYEGIPGNNDYKIIQFKKYSAQIPATTIASSHQETEAKTMNELIENYAKPHNAAELQWRISIPLSVFFLGLLAVPLSHVRPRQGRYSTILPAILIYVIYLDLLFIGRNWIEQKILSVYVGLWWVHLIFLSVVILFAFVSSGILKRWMNRT